MAIVKACTVINAIENIGVTCSKAMGATAMLIACPPDMKFTIADMADPVSWMRNLIHAAEGVRVFPFFGNKAPIRSITNNKENDVLATLDDGSTHFVRYGFVNRTFSTTSGGICYAKALASLKSSGYNIIEIDKSGQMLVTDNGDGTLSPMPTDFIYSPSPMVADLKTVYQNQFMMTYDPDFYVQNGLILDGARPILSMMGLIDAKVTIPAIASTTKLKIGVVVDCTNANLVSLLGAPLATASNFIVTNKATGAISVVTSAIVSGVIELTGTFTTGVTYNVIGAIPSVLRTNLVVGYDIIKGADILIP